MKMYRIAISFLQTNQFIVNSIRANQPLFRLVNDILDGMEHQKVTEIIGLDLSVAYDTVDHSILIKVLECLYDD